MVGIKIKERRIELDITQDALCARIAETTQGQWNPDRRDVYRIERGTRIISDLELVAIAAALELDACKLLMG